MQRRQQYHSLHFDQPGKSKKVYVIHFLIGFYPLKGTLSVVPANVHEPVLRDSLQRSLYHLSTAAANYYSKMAWFLSFKAVIPVSPSFQFLYQTTFQHTEAHHLLPLALIC